MFLIKYIGVIFHSFFYKIKINSNKWYSGSLYNVMREYLKLFSLVPYKDFFVKKFINIDVYIDDDFLIYRGLLVCTLLN